MIRRKHKEYKISDEDFAKCKAFVEARLAENQDLYKKRGGFKEEDLWVGVLAEFASYYYLKEKKIEVDEPDLKIYNSRKKSYNADLSDGKRQFHVKGQSERSASLYGDSWLMQRYDKIVKNPHRNHFIVPCRVDIDKRKVKIWGIVSNFAIHRKGCWGECKHPAFRTTKVAIYLDSLYDKLSNKQMWSV